MAMLGAACETTAIRPTGPVADAAEEIRKVLPNGWSVSVSTNVVTVERTEKVANVGFQPEPTVLESLQPARRLGTREKFTITLTFKEVVTDSEVQRIRQRRAWLRGELERLQKAQEDDYKKLKASGLTDINAQIFAMNTYEPMRMGIQRSLKLIRIPFGRAPQHTVWIWISPDIRQLAPRSVSEECAGVLKKIRSRFIAYEDDEK
ncbi:MAG: hypothetical protein HY300_04135 [Verrucomicrobia bacterium]|nr:hypothetical protein [Verrucomicrobiota bacterium]